MLLFQGIRLIGPHSDRPPPALLSALLVHPNAPLPSHLNCRRPPSTIMVQSVSASHYNLFLHELFLAFKEDADRLPHSWEEAVGPLKLFTQYTIMEPPFVATQLTILTISANKKGIVCKFAHPQSHLSVMMITILQRTNKICYIKVPKCKL